MGRRAARLSKFQPCRFCSNGETTVYESGWSKAELRPTLATHFTSKGLITFGLLKPQSACDVVASLVPVDVVGAGVPSAIGFIQ